MLTIIIIIKKDLRIFNTCSVNDSMQPALCTTNNWQLNGVTGEDGQ